MIAAGLTLGIAKRELMEDYYPAELPVVLKAYTDRHGAEQSDTEAVDPMTFFGTGGETVDG